MFENFLFVPVTVLVFLAIFSCIYFENWLAPGAFFAMCWLIYTLAPLIFTPEFPVSQFSLWIIVLSAFSVLTGSMLAHPYNNKIKKFKHEIKSDIYLQFLLQLILIFSIVSLIGVILLLFQGSRMFGLEIFSKDIWRLGNLFSVIRYGENYSPPFYIRILTYFLFPASLIGGFVFVFLDSRLQKFLTILPILVEVLSAVIVAARAGLYISIFMWVSAFLSAKLYKLRGDYKLFNFRNILIIFMGIIFLMISFYLIQTIREGGEIIMNFEKFSSMLGHMKVSILGYLSAFSTWLGSSELSNPTFGAYTFAGLFNLIGLRVREQGLYSEPVYFLTGGQTNVYTIFRALIDDFTIPGSFVVWFIVGFISTWAYKKTCNGHFFWSILLSAFYAATLFSNLTSIFYFNSVLFSWPLIIVIECVARSIKKKTKKTANTLQLE